MPRATRALFVHDHKFAPQADGTVRTPGAFSYRVWQRYLRHFDELVVAARRGAPADGRALPQASGPRVRFVFAPNISGVRHSLRARSEARRLIGRQIAEADAVIVRLPSELGLAAVELARGSGKAYLVEVVGCARDSYGTFGSLTGRLYAPLAGWRMRRAVAAAPLALYVTHSWLQSRYPTRGIWVAASNVELVLPDDDVRARRAERLTALASGGKPILGTIASLTSGRKGIQPALAALARLKRQGLSLHYRVLGEGDVGPWIAAAREQNIGDLVRFEGTASNRQEVMAWLDGIDLYLQPSLSEGLPRATIEAMSRGCACIGTDVGGLPELLPPERRVRPADPSALAALIETLSGDPALLANASDDGFVCAETFDPELLDRQRDIVLGELAMKAAGLVAHRFVRSEPASTAI